MNDLLIKYNTLSPDIQREVNDFLDFVMTRHRGKKMFDMQGWKSKIKDISVWSSTDIEIFENSRNQLNNWKTEEW